MTSRKEGDWIVIYEGDDEILRCKIPEGVTMADIERFVEHLKKEVEKTQYGPN